MKKGDKVICIKSCQWGCLMAGVPEHSGPKKGEILTIHNIDEFNGFVFLDLEEYLLAPDGQPQAFWAKYFRKIEPSKFKSTELTKKLSQEAEERSIERIEVVPERELENA